MPLEGIVVLLKPNFWYVAAPCVATPGEYHAMTSPLRSRADARKVCRELSELEPADYSPRTRQATEKPDPEKRHI